MRSTSGYSLLDIILALLLSFLSAGAICALTSPVTADNVAVIATSVNRTGKNDRLGIAQQAGHNFTTAKKPASPQHTPFGCEAAFSPFANPGRTDVLNYCVT
jgi:hypothetical protein